MPRPNPSEESPRVPDHELLRPIGDGSFGVVWLARNVMNSFRAIKVVYRRNFKDERPYLREFQGIRHFDYQSEIEEVKDRVRKFISELRTSPHEKTATASPRLILRPNPAKRTNPRNSGPNKRG